MAGPQWTIGEGITPVDEILVYDGVEPCPYIPGRRARMPLRLQLSHDPRRFDALLAEGDRRVGPMLYRPRCPNCKACIDVRIPVADFRRSRSHRRVWRRNRDLRVVEREPVADEEHLGLFNAHKLSRALGRAPLDLPGYVGWLVRTFTDTREFGFYAGDRLVGVGIVDVGHRATSAVYFYFDPAESRRSLGVYSILYAIEWARQRGFVYHYLGLYVADNPHLSYKGRFLPQERLEDGAWRRYERTGRA